MGVAHGCEEERADTINPLNPKTRMHVSLEAESECVYVASLNTLRSPNEKDIDRVTVNGDMTVTVTGDIDRVTVNGEKDNDALPVMKTADDPDIIICSSLEQTKVLAEIARTEQLPFCEYNIIFLRGEIEVEVEMGEDEDGCDQTEADFKDFDLTPCWLSLGSHDNVFSFQTVNSWDEEHEASINMLDLSLREYLTFKDAMKKAHRLDVASKDKKDESVYCPIDSVGTKGSKPSKGRSASDSVGFEAFEGAFCYGLKVSSPIYHGGFLTDHNKATRFMDAVLNLGITYPLDRDAFTYLPGADCDNDLRNWQLLVTAEFAVRQQAATQRKTERIWKGKETERKALAERLEQFLKDEEENLREEELHFLVQEKAEAQMEHESSPAKKVKNIIEGGPVEFIFDRQERTEMFYEIEEEDRKDRLFEQQDPFRWMENDDDDSTEKDQYGKMAVIKMQEQVESTSLFVDDERRETNEQAICAPRGSWLFHHDKGGKTAFSEVEARAAR
jgi:hypothetical protein